MLQLSLWRLPPPHRLGSSTPVFGRASRSRESRRSPALTRFSSSPTLMSIRPSLLATLSLCAISAATVHAQVTTASINVGVAGTFGCQGAGSPPPITGGYLASAHLSYSYDAGTAQLTIEVENTSAVQSGVPNPLITTLYFNTPHLAITGLQLLSQSGAGGATPAFALTFDPDTTNGGLNAACLGEFNARLTKNTGGPNGAIANANADTLAGTPVTGPVSFVFQCFGTNLGGLSADAFTNSLSLSGVEPAAAAIHFQAAGAGAEESGWLADNAQGCRKAIWVAGNSSIGSTVQLVTSGDHGCHGCLLISLNPGPIVLSGVVIPVGFPLLLEGGFFLTGDADTLPITIPQDPNLAGTTVYFAVVVFDQNSQAGFSSSQAFTLTITS